MTNKDISVPRERGYLDWLHAPIVHLGTGFKGCTQCDTPGTRWAFESEYRHSVSDTAPPKDPQ